MVSKHAKLPKGKFPVRRTFGSRTRLSNRSKNVQKTKESKSVDAEENIISNVYDKESITSDVDSEKITTKDDADARQRRLEEQLNHLDHVEIDTGSDFDGEDAELHIYEKRFDTRGEKVFLRVGTKTKIDLPKGRSPRACLILTRHYDYNRKLDHTLLEIQSRHVKKALQDVIGLYPGVDLTTSKPINLVEPPKCLFHYRDELRAYADESGNPKLKTHVDLCLRYMEKSLAQEIELFNQAMTNNHQSPELDHCNLWIVYKPGCLIYLKDGNVDIILRLRSIQLEGDDYETPDYWKLCLEQIKYDGHDFPYIRHTVKIDKFEGRMPVNQLAAFPLSLHPDETRIRRDLLERGKKYASLSGIHHCFYDGPAKFPSPTFMKLSTKFSVKQRIMLDTKAYQRFSNYKLDIYYYESRVFRTASNEHLNMSDEEFLICHHELHGYSLVLQMWGVFNVTHIHDVDYSTEAFDHLVFPEEKKSLISSLVAHHASETGDFDDYIKGKGKGLIFLLHGPPGVGKTFTAESIADRTHRPLFNISFSALFTTNVENLLTERLALATSWNAVVLLDEADVFLQKRSLSEIWRNGLVSTLLRTLEYFEGVLFLTTNRVETIDSAIMSRIHLAVTYPPLSSDARQELWADWITKSCSGCKPLWLTKDMLDHISKMKVNGREIKNIMRIAHSLARNEKREIQPSDITQALELLEKFNHELLESTVESKPDNVKSMDRPQARLDRF